MAAGVDAPEGREGEPQFMQFIDRVFLSEARPGSPTPPPMANRLFPAPTLQRMREVEVRLGESVEDAAARTARDDARAFAEAEARRLALPDHYQVRAERVTLPSGEPIAESDAHGEVLEDMLRRMTERIDREIGRVLLTGPGTPPPAATSPSRPDAPQTYFGIPVVVDPTMEPGTWRLENGGPRILAQYDGGAPMRGQGEPVWTLGNPPLAWDSLRELRVWWRGDFEAEYRQQPASPDGPAAPLGRMWDRIVSRIYSYQNPRVEVEADENGVISRTVRHDPAAEARYEREYLRRRVESHRERLREEDLRRERGEPTPARTREFLLIADARAVRREAEAEGHRPRVLALNPADLRAVVLEMRHTYYCTDYGAPDWEALLWDDPVVVPWDRLEPGEIFLCEDEVARIEGLL